ncbi:hypothetical protein FACS1894151_01300 [Spirochaetia bacterium]|nr:hypothetical protein FACS1894151_01300 [Spirochaetia bacterium]
MPMKDIKSIEVEPEDEDKTVQLWMSFGWELKNNQRVKTQDVQRFTGQDSDGTKHYQTTRGVDFIKLTFERDPERKNYTELKVLEEQYYVPLPSIRTAPPGDKPKKPGVISLILTIISLSLGVFFLIFVPLGAGVTGVIIGVPFSVLGIRSIIRRRSFSSRLKSWEAANETYQTNHDAEEKAISEAKKKRVNALEKAQSLV